MDPIKPSTRRPSEIRSGRRSTRCLKRATFEDLRNVRYAVEDAATALVKKVVKAVKE